jgi:hypothetical protein
MRDTGIRICVLLCVALVTFASAEEKENLAPNPSFETPSDEEPPLPEGWMLFTSKLKRVVYTKELARTGDHAVKITAQGSGPAWSGIKTEVPVEGGSRYTFQAYVRNSKEDPLKKPARGALVIEWLNKDHKEISRAMSTDWDQALSRMRWTRVLINKEQAPAHATSAIFGIHLLEDASGQGTYYVDDISLTVK